MNIILLSGGSGKRLWPLSNDIRSKQFIKIFKNKETGNYESMVQRVFRQIKTIDSDANVLVATSKSQISELHNQVGDDVRISVEPCRRDTFPAIALATAYLKDVQGISEDESVVVCPVDPLVDDSYFDALKKLSDIASKGDANLVVMGIEPTYPSEKYGYVIPKTKENISLVSTFKEKPTADIAQQYIEQGALWNAGVFAYKIGYVLKKAHELINFTDYNDFFNKYETVKKISFDYAVAEHEPNIQVLRYNGKWTDLGTWNTLTESMDDNTIGNVTLNKKCENVHAVNAMDVPLLCMGLKNIIVAASPEGILVSTPEESSYIKPIVDTFDSTIKFAEKSWGEYKVIDVTSESLTIKVTLKKGHQMSYHCHEHRDETWTIVSGNGTVIIDEVVKKVSPGDIITMPRGCKHTIIATTDLQLIEVQIGKEISIKDKTKCNSTYIQLMPEVELGLPITWRINLVNEMYDCECFCNSLTPLEVFCYNSQSIVQSLNFSKGQDYKSHNAEACIYSIRAIKYLLTIGDIIDTWVLIRKIRDNLLLEAVLFDVTNKEYSYNKGTKQLKDMSEEEAYDYFNNIMGQVLIQEKNDKDKNTVSRYASDNLSCSDKKSYFGYSAYKKYFSQSEKLKEIICHFDSQLHDLEKLLNNFVHTNGESFADNSKYNSKKKLMEQINEIKASIDLLCRLFFSLTWSINSSYYHSSDYIGSLDIDETPIEGRQYLLAPIIEDYLNEIKNTDFKLYKILSENNSCKMLIN